MRRLAIQESPPGARTLEAEDDANERRLPSAVRPGDSDELSLAELEVHVLEHVVARAVPERHVAQLDGYLHPSAFRNVARFQRIRER